MMTPEQDVPFLKNVAQIMLTEHFDQVRAGKSVTGNKLIDKAVEILESQGFTMRGPVGDAISHLYFDKPGSDKIILTYAPGDDEQIPFIHEAGDSGYQYIPVFVAEALRLRIDNQILYGHMK